MSDFKYIGYDAYRQKIDWHDAVRAIEEGHKNPKAVIEDVFLAVGDKTLLNRSAYIAGIGFGVKAVTVFGENAAKNLPTVQGAMSIFDPNDGHLRGIVESRLVTEIKTAADSLLGAKILAQPKPEHLLIIGAGTVAQSLISAYSALFPSLKTITLWARRYEAAQEVVKSFSQNKIKIEAASNLQAACEKADIISSATLAKDPIIKGEWITPGTHIDLIGAFRADMREADDAVLQKGKIFVDSYDTTLHHIGEIKIPLEQGVIKAEDILGDFYDLLNGQNPTRMADDITIFKNGGGAHLDLMIAEYILAL